MRRHININFDAGEGFGNYAFGADAELMGLVPTANIACGYHAGDPHVMRKTVQLAVRHNVEIGAHVGLPDLVGFGRRRIDVAAADLRDYVTYQIGALQAFAAAEGTTVSHVKPHGVLYAMCGERLEYAEALVSAVAALVPNARIIVGGDLVARVGLPLGIKATNEGYVDLDYGDNGYPIIERVKAERNPQEVADRAVRLVTRARAPIRGSDQELSIDVPTICIHGDAPRAAAVGAAVVSALRAAGTEIVGLATAMDSAD